MNKQRLIQLVIVAALLMLALYINQTDKTGIQSPSTDVTVTKVDGVVKAYTQKKSDVLVRGKGEVVKLLADDLKGSKHQRFLVRYNDKQTLLISHNIDLAPRIDGLQVGDIVEFYGEYVYNKKGGIIHWTHHDPAGRHPDGWLRHKEKVYQ